MRNLLRQSVGVLVVFSALACGSNDDDAGTSESSEGAAASGTAGKTGNSGGSTSSTRGGTGGAGAMTGASGTKGTTTTPRGGTSGTTPATAAGKGGAGGKGADVADDDAGVPAGGSGGSAAHGGSGGDASHAGQGGGGSGGATAAAGSGGGTASAATFTQVYALISTGCAGTACHVNANVAGGMLAMPDKATAYKNLVNADAVECRGEKRVVPNDPAKSELVASLKHIQVGSCTRTPKMPDNMPQWSESDIALVTSWVEAGAQDN